MERLWEMFSRIYLPGGDLYPAFKQALLLSMPLAFIVVVASFCIALFLVLVVKSKLGSRAHAHAIFGTILALAVALPVKQLTLKAIGIGGSEGMLFAIYLAHLIPMYAIFWSIVFSYSSDSAYRTYFNQECTSRLGSCFFALAKQHFSAHIHVAAIFLLFATGYIIFDDKSIINNAYFSYRTVEDSFQIYNQPQWVYIAQLWPVAIYLLIGAILIVFPAYLLRPASLRAPTGASTLGTSMPSLIFGDKDRDRFLSILKRRLRAMRANWRSWLSVQSIFPWAIVILPFVFAAFFLVVPLWNVWIIDLIASVPVILQRFTQFLGASALCVAFLLLIVVVLVLTGSRKILRWIMFGFFGLALMPAKVLATIVAWISPAALQVMPPFDVRLLITYTLAFGVFPLFLFVTHVEELQRVFDYAKRGLRVSLWNIAVLYIKTMEKPFLYGLVLMLLLIVGDSAIYSALNIPRGSQVVAPAYELYLMLSSAGATPSAVASASVDVIILTLVCVMSIPLIGLILKKSMELPSDLLNKITAP